jgi:hypothetical protein
MTSRVSTKASPPTDTSLPLSKGRDKTFPTPPRPSSLQHNPITSPSHHGHARELPAVHVAVRRAPPRLSSPSVATAP